MIFQHFVFAKRRLFAIIHQLTKMGRTARFYLDRPVRRPLADLYDRDAFGDCYKEVWYNERTPLVFVIPVVDIEAPALMFKCKDDRHFAVQLNRGEDYC